MDAMTFLRDRVPLFAGVSEANLAVLAESSVLTPFKDGQTILFRGTTVDGLHIVGSGKACVYVKEPNRAAPTLAAELGVGEVFGETSIVEKGVAGATVKASGGDAHILMIPQQAFRHVLQQDEGFAVRVNTLIAGRKPVSAPSR